MDRKTLRAEANLFAARLDKINTGRLGIEGYPLDYLHHLLLHKSYYLYIYGDMIQLASAGRTAAFGEHGFVDFGCGNGLLALFAAHLGFRQVFACDRSPLFLSAARKLGAALGLGNVRWIAGDLTVDDLPTNDHDIRIWAASDVIEHLYDIGAHIAQIKRKHPEAVCVFTTASVNENPVKRRKLRDLMLRDELKDSDSAQSESPFPGMPFLKLRERLIRDRFPEMETAEVHRFAVAARGLSADDFLPLVETSFKHGLPFPYSPPDPFNTCDPISGSFTERLLPMVTYATLFGRNGYALETVNGYYDTHSGGPLKRGFAKAANLVLAHGGRWALPMAPFVFLIGRPSHTYR